MVESTGSSKTIKASTISILHIPIINEVVIEVIKPVIKILPRGFSRLLTTLIVFGSFVLILFLESLGLMPTVFLNRSQSIIILDPRNHSLNQLIEPMLARHHPCARMRVIFVHS